MKYYTHIRFFSSLSQVLVCPEDSTVAVLPHPVKGLVEDATVTYSVISMEIAVLIFRRLDAFHVC